MRYLVKTGHPSLSPRGDISALEWQKGKVGEVGLIVMIIDFSAFFVKSRGGFLSIETTENPVCRVEHTPATKVY
jgi:hypothetical protein